MRQGLIDLSAVRQMGQCVITGQILYLLATFALDRDVRTHSSKPGPKPVFIEHGRARHLPPAQLFAGRHLHDEVGKAFFPLQLLCKLVQASVEFTGLPAIAGNELQKRLALDLRNIASYGIGQSRAD